MHFSAFVPWRAWKNAVRGSTPTYSPLSQHRYPSPPDDVPAHDRHWNTKASASICWLSVILIQGLVNVVLLAYLMLVNSQLSRSQSGTYETGFPVELTQSLQGLTLHERQFGGELVYNASKMLVINHQPNELTWVGEPSAKIDSLWDDIAEVEVLYLTGEDADSVRGRTTWQDGQWLTGLDVIHQLHCLNRIRKALHPDFYPLQQSQRVENLHNDHCLDYIRQAIMCNADVTPILNRWDARMEIFTPDFGTKHMCRDFEGILKWARSRNSPNGAGFEPPPKDRTLVVISDDQYAHAHGHGHNQTHG